MNITFFIFLAFCLIGLIIRTVYEILKKTDRIDPKSKVVFVFVFVGMVLMLTSWMFICPTDPSRILLPGFVKGVGLGVLIVGLGIALAALFQLRGLENIDHLVTTGLFSKLRHPMYLGFILWILGWVIFTGAVVSFVFALAAIGCILFWRRLEEEKLVSDFGDEYLKYRKSTWF